MNNYNRLEKFLHKIALSSKLIREVSFDLESNIISSKSFCENSIFISGLARSGTTILLNAIHKSNCFASLTYSDMPFVLAPNLWSKISFKKNNNQLKERAHGDGIKYSVQSPEAFEEVFWKTFDENDEDSFYNFKKYINNIIFKYKKNRYLSKNNQNIKRVELISEFFPQAKILIPFREPIQHSYSLFTQHKKFIKYAKHDRFISKYMKWIGHTEFGPNYLPINNNNLIFKNPLILNHWLEQWNKTYSNCLNKLRMKKNVHFISYERLCNSKDYWLDIQNILEIKNNYDFEFIESIKEIKAKIDHDLLNKSKLIYSDLNNQTL